MANSVIKLTDVSKTYGTGSYANRVLKDVSFEIEEGEFISIIGPSGSGKSTLMSILGLLDNPTKGQYVLDGQDVSKLDDDRLAEIRSSKIGFVFQSFNLLSRTTVFRNVELPLVYSKINQKDRQSKVISALKSANLEESLFNNLSNQLSGGQMQRVAIARALVNDPSLILADEPTGNLDQKTGLSVLKTFEQLNNEGRTIILITHDVNVAQFANRVIEVSDGKIVSDLSKRSKK